MSDKVDAWVKKEPESWSKLAEKTKQGDSFDSFKKKFLKGARNQGKYNAVKHMTNDQILSKEYFTGNRKMRTKRMTWVIENLEKY